MRVIDLLVIYLGVGVACAIAVGRLVRNRTVSVTDRMLVVFVWPLYVPALLSPAPVPTQATQGSAANAIRAEKTGLIAAMEAMAQTPLATCLPHKTGTWRS